MTNNISTYNNKNSTIPLPKSFQPGPFDVICGRGKKATCHSGNLRYRSLVDKSLQRYKSATTKYEKTVIVTDIYDQLGGLFVKEVEDNTNSGMYCEVSEQFAREKIGQHLRDALSSKYKSSSKAKKTRRDQYNAQMAMDVDALLQTNHYIAFQMNSLVNHLQECNQECHQQNKKLKTKDNNTNTTKNTKEETELFIDQLFLNTNRGILEAFKNDVSLVQKFVEAEWTHKHHQFDDDDNDGHDLDVTDGPNTN